MKSLKRMAWMAVTALAAALLAAPAAPADPLRFTVRPENRTILVPGDGMGTVQIEVFSADDPASRDRAPLNLALVLDRSGSMGDARKWEYARQAAHELIDRLGREDSLAIVAYDDVVEVPLPCGSLESREAAHRLVDQLFPRGRTFLSGGVEEGFHQVRKNRRPGSIGRVLLVSDGLANVGLTDRVKLAEWGSYMAERGVSLSTFGVGAEFDEDVLCQMAVRGGGTYHYLARPADIVAALGREFHLASRTVAGEVEILIRVRPGCRFDGVVGYPWSWRDGAAVVRLGALAAGEKRTVFARMASSLDRIGLQTVGEVEVGWREAGTERGVKASPSGVAFELVRDEAAFRKGYDQEVQGRRAVTESQVKAAEAAALVDQGRKQEALRVLGEAKAVLAAAPRSAPVVREKDQLDGYAGSVMKFETLAPGEQETLQKGVKYRSYQGVQRQ